ncbi:MAG TPA: GC-type dockerin domain-anchored protein [Phycisphaerales bacterium]|nr:GC-type dockerin domain-anchored protein [Phycisphaerales bacterium]
MPRLLSSARLAPLALSLACAPAASAGVGYTFTVSQSTSTLTYSFSASAPFGSGGTPAVASTLIGENDPAKPAAEQTRTRQMQNIFTCGGFTAGQNAPITISGAIAASGNSSGQPAVHPGGTFNLGLDTGALTCRLQDLNVNLIAAGGPISAAANLNNFNYQSFCTINPACNAPFILPISLPLGTIGLTSLLAQQAPGVPDSGTLTAAGPNTWNFSVTTAATVTPVVTFGGAPLAADPQQVPLTISGTVTLSGNTASITASTQLDYAPPATTPGPQPATAFSVPPTSTLCAGINIVLTLNILSTTITSSNSASIPAAGAKLPCRCDANNNGALEVQDIFDFLNLWLAGNPAADFNGGGLSVQDIFDFLNCWLQNPVGC